MERGGRFVRVALLGLLLLVGAFMFGACGGGGEADETVNFGTVDWPEAVAKTNVASTIVDALGYQTEVQELGVPTVFQGLDTGDLDVFVEAWFPTMQTNFDEVQDVESVTTNLEQATFSIAVNQEACEAGVTSHEDLAQFADRFEEGGRPTIYGLEPGGNRIEVTTGGYFVFDPEFEPVVWTEAERAKGQAWGVKTVESFHTYGTPPVEAPA